MSRVCACLLAGTTLAAKDETAAQWLTAPFERIWREIEKASPTLRDHPGLFLSTLTVAGVAGAAYYARYDLS